MLTMYGEDEFVLAALRAGARGYLFKRAQQADVIRTITAVANGDAVLGHDIADRLASMLTPTPQRRYPSADSPVENEKY